jgi:hypothetical protein
MPTGMLANSKFCLNLCRSFANQPSFDSLLLHQVVGFDTPHKRLLQADNRRL